MESRGRRRWTEGGVRHDDVVLALSRPSAHPGAVDEVEVRRTPLSVLFFAGDRVYKLPRPAERDPSGWPELEESRCRCEEEVRLNRRSSSGLYRGVLAVTQQEDGRISLDGEGTTVDWVVEMTRLPADRMLDALLDRGEVRVEQLDRVAAALVRFHDCAMTGPAVNRHGLVESVVARTRDVLGRLEESLETAGRGSSAIALLRRRAREFPYRRRDLFERRVAEWRIRDGHGDLRARRISLLPEAVHVFGCMELDRSARCGDVASDLAALLVDLDHRGHAPAADRLARAYALRASDADLLRLVPYYRTCRALVRAGLELEASRDERLEPDVRELAAREARRYVQLAVGYELPNHLVLVGSRLAPVRSEVASYVAGRLRAALVRGGRVPARGAGADRGALEPEAVLGCGSSVVVEAPSSDPRRARSFVRAAEERGLPVCYLWLEAPGRGARGMDGPRLAGDLQEDLVLRRSAGGAPEQHCQALQERMVDRVVLERITRR